MPSLCLTLLFAALCAAIAEVRAHAIRRLSTQTSAALQLARKRSPAHR
jgi:hypothetical protein